MKFVIERPFYLREYHWSVSKYLFTMRISSDWSQTVQQLCQWCNRAIGKVSWNLCQADLQSCIGFRLLPHFVLLAWKACRTALRSPHSSLLLLKQHICTTAIKFHFHSLSWIRFLVIFFFFLSVFQIVKHQHSLYELLLFLSWNILIQRVNLDQVHILCFNFFLDEQTGLINSHRKKKEVKKSPHITIGSWHGRNAKRQRWHWYIPRHYSGEKNLINVTTEEVTFILADQIQWSRPSCTAFSLKVV